MGECNRLIVEFEAERKAADDYRKPFEDVWIESYQAFNNQYPANTKFRANGSRVYYSLTRAKVNSAWAREWDILNNNKGQIPWTIEPTPDAKVPIKRVVDFIVEKLPPEAQQAVAERGVGVLMDMVPKKIFEDAEQALAVDAMKKMRRKIEDAMVEDRAMVKLRNAMLEKVITGTCILKFGTCERHITSWETDVEGYNYCPKVEYSPSIKSPSLFNVWFDPNAYLLIDNGTIQSCEYVYERYPMTHSELLDLANKPAFDAEAIRAVLRDGPNSEETQSDRDLRDMWGGNKPSKNSQYDVYERTGFVTVEQLRLAGVDFGECEGEDGELEIDDTELMNMSIWYCNNHIIKVVELPDKVTRIPYMVVPQELAPGHLYGVGIPWKMRNGQALLNSTIRLFIDCKANASGPITFVNADVWDASDNPEDDLQPWGVVPLEIPKGQGIRDVLSMEKIPDVSEQMQSLLNLAKHQCDEESQIPAFEHASASKELARATGQTSSGMAMILGMADLAHKMAIQNIDDFFIVPCITMYYNWFMQFSDDESIKGDMKVQALGTIGVMKKEVLSQRLTQLITQTSNPVDSQIFNRQQLWLDVIDAYGLDENKYMVKGMPGAPPGAPQPAPPGQPQTMVQGQPPGPPQGPPPQGPPQGQLPPNVTPMR